MSNYVEINNAKTCAYYDRYECVGEPERSVFQNACAYVVQTHC